MFVDNRIDMLLRAFAAVFRGPPLKRVDDAQVGGNRELAPRRVLQPGCAPWRRCGSTRRCLWSSLLPCAFGEGEVESGVEIAVVLADEQAALLIAGDDLEAVGCSDVWRTAAISRNARLTMAVFRHRRTSGPRITASRMALSGLLCRARGHTSHPTPALFFRGPCSRARMAADAVAGNAEGRQGPVPGAVCPRRGNGLPCELPEAFRELLIAPARTPGGRVHLGMMLSSLNCKANMTIEDSINRK